MHTLYTPCTLYTDTKPHIYTLCTVGDYYYIIQSGLFTVLVDDVAVTKLDDGKSFGDLALLNNTPRAASVRADMDGTLFMLDRNSFRHTLAKSSAAKHKVVYQALSNVPLLKVRYEYIL